MRSPSTREFPSLRLLCTRVKSISKELALVKRKFHLLKPRRSFHNNLVMWVCCMTLYYINYIAWAPPKNYEYLFNIHTFKLNLKFWVELYSPALCVGINIYPWNIHKENCPSQYYYLKLPLITTLSLKIPTLFTIFLLFKLTLFIIRIGVSFFPWEWDSGCPCHILNIEWNTTMQLNNVMLYPSLSYQGPIVATVLGGI